MKQFFNKPANEVLKNFGTTTEGLTDNEVKAKREKYGYNALNEKKKKSTIQVFFEQFKDLLVIILIIAGIVSMTTGNIESTIVIFAVIILNSILGTIQHIKAEQSLNSLKALSAPTAKVIRNGIKTEIPSKDIVPGDILILEAGDLVVADGRIIENYSLQVNESALTGESESVTKTSDCINKDELALGDQKNMVFSSSLVTYGRALVIVTATGMNSELVKLLHLWNKLKKRKHLYKLA